jgi:uncharacterized protein YceK
MKKMILLAIILILSGCASLYPVDQHPPPPYEGIAYITVDSDPQGARVYGIDNKYIDTTPFEEDSIGWDLDFFIRKEGNLTWGPVTIIKEGYFPIKKTYQLELPPSGERYYHFHDLVILERDPNAPLAPTASEESTLDQLMKAGQIGLILQPLKPIR